MTGGWQLQHHEVDATAIPAQLQAGRVLAGHLTAAAPLPPLAGPQMADHYAREAARIAGLALADSAGFDAVQTSCGEILADLLLRYVHEVRRRVA